MKKHSKDNSAVTESLSRKVAAAQRLAKSARQRALLAKAGLKRMRKAFKLAKKAAKESRRTLKTLFEELRQLTKSAPKHQAKKKKAHGSAPKKSPVKKAARARPKSVKSSRPRATASVVPAPLPAPVTQTPDILAGRRSGPATAAAQLFNAATRRPAAIAGSVSTWRTCYAARPQNFAPVANHPERTTQAITMRSA